MQGYQSTAILFCQSSERYKNILFFLFPTYSPVRTMSRPSFKCSTSLDDDAITFLADPKNRGSKKKKGTVEDQSSEDDPSEDKLVNDYYAMRRLNRKQKRPERRTDPVTFQDIFYTYDYDDWLSGCFVPKLGLATKGPLSMLHWSFTMDKSKAPISRVFVECRPFQSIKDGQVPMILPDLSSPYYLTKSKVEEQTRRQIGVNLEYDPVEFNNEIVETIAMKVVDEGDIDFDSTAYK